MQLPDWLKRLIDRKGTRSPKEALQDLDAIVTRNEMGLDALRAEIEKTDAQLHAEENKIRDKQVDGWQKRFVLQSVRRLRTHLLNLDRRMGIYDKNLTVALALIGKVEDMQAMSLRGVNTEEIDKVILDFEEQMAKYLDVVGINIEPSDPVEEERELQDLEKEILGVKEEPRKQRETPVRMPIEVVEVQTTAARRRSHNSCEEYNSYEEYPKEMEEPLYE